MRKFVLVLAVLVATVGMAFAENKLCMPFDNTPGGGIYVNVSSVRVKKEDITVAEYDNTITVMSNGNKMRIIECKIDRGNNGRGSYGKTGYVLEPYGEHTEHFTTYERPLKPEQVHVKGEGCN